MPVVNFIGNKGRLASWIYQHYPKGASSLFDAFSGGSSVSYFFKAKRMQIVANDAMIGSATIAKALIENNHEKLDPQEVESLVHPKQKSHNYFENKYSEVKFFRDECVYLDKVRTSIDFLNDDYRKALAFTSIRRAMIRKMPYSRFNIPWGLIKMLRDEKISYERWGRKRSYHNEPFGKHVKDSINAYNSAVFDNGRENKVTNMDTFDALKLTRDVDVVYFDPPYAGKMNDYVDFYGLFDEFITCEQVKPFKNDFTNKSETLKFLEKMFRDSQHIPYWIMSYNSRSYPSKEQILEILKPMGNVEVVSKEHDYKLTNKQNKKADEEYLFLVST